MAFDRKRVNSRKLILGVVLSCMAMAVAMVFVFLFLRNHLVKSSLDSINRGINGKLETGAWSFHGGTLEIDNLQCTLADGTKVCSIRKIEIAYRLTDLVMNGNMAAAVREISIDAPQVFITRDSRGVFNFTTLQKEKGKKLPWEEMARRFRGNIYVREGTLEFHDRYGTTFSSTWSAINAALEHRENSLFAGTWQAQEHGRPACRLRGSCDLTTDPPRLSMSLEGESLNMGSWGNYLVRNKEVRFSEGTGSLHAEIRGTGTTLGGLAHSLFVEGTLRVQDEEIFFKSLGDSLKKISAVVEFNSRLLDFKSLTGVFKGARCRLEGVVIGPRDPLLDLSIQVEGLDMDRLREIKAFHAKRVLQRVGDARGILSCTVHLDGPLKNPEVKGKIELSGGRIFNLDIKEAEVQGRFMSGGIRIDSLHCGVNGGKVSGYGWIFPDAHRVMLSLSGEAAAFRWKTRSGGSVEGVGDFSLDVLGDSSRPLLMGRALLHQFSIGQYSYGKSSADFIMSGDTLFLKEGLVSKDRGILQASGIFDMREERLDLTVRASRFPIPSMGFTERTRVKGELSGLVNVFGTVNAPLFSGIIGSPGFLQVGALTLQDPFIPVQSDGDVISISRGTVTLGGNPIAFRGDVMLGSSPFMQMTVRSRNTDLAALSGGLPFRTSGRGDLSATITGGPSVGYLWSGDGRVNNGAVHSSGWINPGMAWIGSLSLDDVPLERSSITLNKKAYPLSGVLDSGDALMRGGPHGIEMGCTMYFLGASFLGFPFSSLNGDAMLSGSALSLSNADIRGDAGALSFSGRMDLRKKTYAISGDGTALDTGYLSRHLDLSPWGIQLQREMAKRKIPAVNGLASLRGTLRGTGRTPRFDGEVSLDDGSFASEALSFQSAFSLIPHGAFINSLLVHTGRSTYEGHGKVVYSPELSLDVSVNAQKGDMAKILSLTPWKDLGLKGDLNGSFKIRGKPSAPLVDGSALVTAASMGGEPIDEIQAELTTRNNDLILDNLVVKFPEGKIRGSGRITAAGMCDLNFSAENFPVDRLQFARKYLGTVGGAANFDMKVAGPRKDPEISLTFTSADLRLSQNLRYSGDGAVRWKGNTLVIDQISLNNEDEHYRLNGTVDFLGHRIPLGKKEWAAKGGNPPVLDVNADLQNARLENLLRQFIGKADMSGKVDGKVSLKGSLNAPTYDIDVAVHEGKIKGVPIEQARAKIQCDNKRLTISELVVKMPSSSLQIGGTIDLVADSGKNEVTVNIQNFDMSLLSDLMPKVVKLGGILDMNARVSGSLMLPDVTSEVKVAQGFVGGFDFAGLSGKVMASKGVFSLRDFLVEEKGSKMTVSGNVPLMLQKNKVVSTAPMDVKMNVKAGDLDILSLFIPMQGKTEGTLNGDMEVSGVFPDIMLKGLLSIKDGKFQPAALQKPVTDLKTLVKFGDEKVLIKSMEGKIGQGAFTISGELDLSGSSLKKVDLKMLAKDLEVYAKKYFTGRTDADLTLTGDGSQQALLGSITANNATINIPNEVMMRSPEENEKEREKLIKSIPPALKNLFTNIHVNFNSDDWFTFMTSSLLMKGGVTVAGRVPDLELMGELELSRGTLNLPLLEVPFKVYQGKAYFDGQDWSPSLDLEAQADIGKYRIYLDFLGKMDNPRVELTSEPPMQREEIARVLSGAVMTNFVPSGALAADAMATRLAERVFDLNLVQPIFHAIGRSFGLSDVALEYNYNGAWAVRVAKAIDSHDRFMVTYDRVMLTNGILQNLYGFEYRFQKGMLVRLAEDDNGTVYYWIQTKYRF